MEFLQQAQDLWNEYGPMIMGIGGTLLAVGGTILALYVKLKPVWDAMKSKIDVMFDKSTDDVKEDITNKLQMVGIETQITDLKAKLENPTISDTLKQSYITQLATLETLKAKLDAGLVKVDDITKTY